MNLFWSKWEFVTMFFSCDLVRIRLVDCRYFIVIFFRGVGIVIKGFTFFKLFMFKVRDILEFRL